MDVFQELMSLENFPAGTNLTLCVDGSFCAAVPRLGQGAIIEYDSDPLVALEKALARLKEIRKR